MCRDDSSVMSIVHVANYSSSTEQLIPLYIQNSSTSPVVTITTVPLPTSMDEKEPVIKCNHQTVPTCFNIIVCKTSVSGIILYGILTNPAKVKSRRHIKPGKWIINQTRNDFVFNLTSSYPMPTLNFSVFSYHADQQMIWSTNISACINNVNKDITLKKIKRPMISNHMNKRTNRQHSERTIVTNMAAGIFARKNRIVFTLTLFLIL
ncbi:hypothetical protein ACOME3_010655 [Neoechinorhynchus agilis]